MNPTMKRAEENAERYTYEGDGFVVSPGALLDAETTAELREHAERVLRGVYETGKPPRSNSGGPDINSHPPYIEASFAQDADNAIAAVIKNPTLARWAAAATGAKRLQVWNAMVMKKYPDQENQTLVGWHQDFRYNSKIVDGATLNCWIALDEVSVETGPLRFIPGSHKWGRTYPTGFFERDVDKQRRKIEVPEGFFWEEVESPLPAGWASIHHTLTLHGSAKCQGPHCRYSMLINYAVDEFKMIPGQYFATRIDDPVSCPVVFEA
jgi:hypothetical protein